MKRWTKLEETLTPDGSTMNLMERDGTYVIRVNGRELMSSRHYGSEERLATVACEPLKARRGLRALIGGLGLGFTLRAALAAVGPDAQVVVAELLPEVVKWNRNPAYGLAADALADPRVRIEMGDVARIIERSAGAYDAIMLDADNNTTSMNTAGNRELYDVGLALVHAALRPGGRAVYWSADADPLFAKRFARAGFTVTTERPATHAGSGARHHLIIGVKQGRRS